MKNLGIEETSMRRNHLILLKKLGLNADSHIYIHIWLKVFSSGLKSREDDEGVQYLNVCQWCWSDQR